MQQTNKKGQKDDYTEKQVGNLNILRGLSCVKATAVFDSGGTRSDDLEGIRMRLGLLLGAE